MQGAMCVESTAIKNAITRVRSLFCAYPSPMGVLQHGCRRISAKEQVGYSWVSGQLAVRATARN